MKLATATEMQQLDRTTIDDYGVPGIDLMENAGCGTVDYMLHELGPVTDKSVIVFVGPGNNGGDGLVIARRLSQLGALPFVIYLVDPARLKGDAALNYNKVKEAGIPFSEMLHADELSALTAENIDPSSGKPPWAIIDAIFGTGLQRPLAGHFLAAVQAINSIRKSTGCQVIAADIPSGMNADTGIFLGAGVEADHTVTYGLAKPGHFIHGGNFCGKLHVVDIGIHPEAVAQAALKGETLGPGILEVFGTRALSSHKGNYGHLLVLAGSAGKTGAAFLCGHGALRIGTGLVTLAVPADLRTVFESNLFEAMTLLLPDSRRYPSTADYSMVIENLADKTAMIIGPGIGTKEKTRKLVIKLYREAEIPMVIDADGLNILAMEPECITDPPAPRILTPHPGEMARLTGLTSKDIQADRLSAIREFTASVNNDSRNVTTILKGAGTIICDPAGTWAINTSGNPGMAAGGMGDVLTGVIGGLLAQEKNPGIAARAGVFVHGLAADSLATESGFGYLASDVAGEIPYIIHESLHNNLN